MRRGNLGDPSNASTSGSGNGSAPTVRKEKIIFQQLNELDHYYFISKSNELALIVIALFVGFYLDSTLGALILGSALFKLFILTLYNIIESRRYEYEFLYATRSQQFWLYRFIFIIQLMLLIWVLFEITTHGSNTNDNDTQPE